MNGQTISWDESKPANTDQVGQGDDQMRSDKTALRTALNDEHNFPSTGGANSGYHRYGSARAFYGVESTVSSSGTDGRLMVSSDKSRLFHVGSGGTMLLGAAAAPVFSLNQTYQGTGSVWGTLPQTHYWAVEMGYGATDSKGSRLVTFASAFSGVPNTMVGPVTNASASYHTLYATILGNSSVSIYSDIASKAFWYMSIGTRLLG